MLTTLICITVYKQLKRRDVRIPGERLAKNTLSKAKAVRQARRAGAAC